MHLIILVTSFPLRTFLYEFAKLVHDSVHRESANFLYRTINFFTISICFIKRGTPSGVPQLLVQRLIFSYIPQVLLHIAVQDQLCIPQRIIEDQIIQF